MISDRDFFRNFGFALEIEPAEPDFLIEETPDRNFLGTNFQVLEVPGHCPGSLCFFSRKDRLLIGGDVLFAGSIGRGDLPGGDIDLLIDGIREKIFPLGDDVTVLSGHGPPTTIGQERLTNPFLRKTTAGITGSRHALKTAPATAYNERGPVRRRSPRRPKADHHGISLRSRKNFPVRVCGALAGEPHNRVRAFLY